MSGKSDPKTYREMSVPFENSAEANEALQDFFNAVEVARKENHIQDVHVIVKVNIANGESEGTAMSSAHFGNTLEGAVMCAWGLGREQESFQAILRQFVKAG